VVRRLASPSAYVARSRRLRGHAEDGPLALRARFAAVNAVHSGGNAVRTRDAGDAEVLRSLCLCDYLGGGPQHL